MRAGIVLSRQSIQVAVLRRFGRRVEWTATAAVDGDERPAATLRSLLDELPASVHSVAIALDADLCQIKLLADLPPMNARRLQQALELNATTWFLRTATRFSATGARLGSSNSVVAAVASREIIEAIQMAVMTSGRRLVTIVPLSTSLAAGFGTGIIRREVGVCVEALDVSEGWIARRRYLPRDFANDLPESQDGGTESSEESESGAVEPAVAVVLRPGPLRFSTEAESVRGWRKEIAAFVVGTGIWITAGAIGFSQLMMARSEARDRLSTLAPQLEVIDAKQEQLVSTRGALEQLRQASSASVSDLLLLQRLTGALPSHVFLTSFVREPGGHVHVEGVIRGEDSPITLLQRVPGISAPRVVGALTRGEGPRDEGVRFTAAFRWTPDDVVDPA